jgi:lysozyme family protein
VTTTDDIITGILIREGPATNDPNDRGGRTAFGISEAANPEAWADGKVTEAEARAIYERKYVKIPGFDKIKDRQLRTQLIDFGVNSGPMVAIMKLQAIVGADVDGILGPQTLESVGLMIADEINSALVAERVKMIGRIVTKNPSQLRFLNGWLARAVQFLG